MMHYKGVQLQALAGDGPRAARGRKRVFAVWPARRPLPVPLGLRMGMNEPAHAIREEHIYLARLD